MEKHVLSKSTFIRGAQCLKSLYLHKKRPFLRDKLSVEQRAKFSRGSDVGKLARNLFPGGINLQPKSPSQYRQAVLQTSEVVESGSHDIIYEAAFQADGVLILLDILQKKNGKWYAYEVKSSLKVSETYLLDAALQYYVITQSGIELEDIYIIHMNSDYVLGDSLDIHQLFISRSVLDEVKQKQAYVKEQIAKSKEAMLLKHSPPIDISRNCFHPYPCDFMGHCWKNLPENSIFQLPHLSLEDKFKYYAQGIPGSDQLMEVVAEKDAHLHILKSHHENTEYRDTDYLKNFLPDIDDKTAFIQVLYNKSALPAIKGTKPYQNIPVAVALSKGTDEESAIVKVFEERKNALEDFDEFINKNLKNTENLLGYEVSATQEYLHQRKLPTLKKLVDLHDLLLNVRFYHPALKNDHTLYNIGKVLLKDRSRGPRSDVALFAEIQKKMSVEDKLIGENEKTKVETYIKKQLQTIMGLYFYLKNQV